MITKDETTIPATVPFGTPPGPDASCDVVENGDPVSDALGAPNMPPNVDVDEVEIDEDEVLEMEFELFDELTMEIFELDEGIGVVFVPEFGCGDPVGPENGFVAAFVCPGKAPVLVITPCPPIAFRNASTLVESGAKTAWPNCSPLQPLPHGLLLQQPMNGAIGLFAFIQV